MATELFTANQATTTVSSGGTTAPSSGTSEMWTVASSAMFGAASTGVSQFHVADPSQPSELIAVTNVSGTAWTVTRGAESTTPVAHAAEFTVFQVASAGWLSSAAGSVNPMTASGDMIYGGSAGAMTRLAGNTAATRKFLRQLGTGSTSAAPAWDTLQYGDQPGTLTPSGDTSGTTDSAAIGAASGHAILAPGEWYIGAPGLTTSQIWLQGSGPATIVNVVSGGTGFTVVGPGQLYVSDMAIAVGSGAYAFTVNGAYDAHFWDLYISGSAAAGGIKINGDDSLEQHWTDVVMRDLGGIAFDYERTTSIYTGSLYLDRVRIVAPPAGAKGFKFNSTAGSASLNTVFMDQCVADGFLEDAYEADNVAQIFVSNSWFAVGGSAASGSAAMRITGGFQHTYTGCYTYNGLTSGVDVVIAGSPNGVYIGGGHVFDGSSGNTALGLSGATLSGSSFVLGQYLNYCGTLTDTPAGLSYGGQAASPPVFYTDSNSASQVIAVIDTANPTGNTKYIRNGDGQLQILNNAYNSTILSLTDAGELIVPSLQTPTLTESVTVEGNVTVTADGTHFNVVSTGSSQYDGPGLYFYNSASSMGNQGGMSIQPGIANSGATEGYVVFSQIDHTGAFVGNLVNIDLNGQTFTVQIPLVAQAGLRLAANSVAAGHLYSGSGAPNISGSGAGDYYFRTDATGTSDERIYVATGANTWTGIL